MNRKRISLELPEDQANSFARMQELFAHDDPEETFATLLHLGEAAISLSSAENPDVRMFTRTEAQGGREVTCPACTKQFIPIFKDDGYREIAVRLS